MTIRFTISPAELGRYEAAFGKGVKGAMRAAALSAAQRTLALVKARTLTAPPASPHGEVGAYAFGEYYRAWKVVRQGDGAVVRNARRYAPFIDGGRRAGARMPPVRALVPWVQLKLNVEQGRDRYGRFRAPDYRGVAFLVARAIARRGLWARNVAGGAMGQAARWFEQAAGKAIDQLLKDARKP